MAASPRLPQTVQQHPQLFHSGVALRLENVLARSLGLSRHKRIGYDKVRFLLLHIGAHDDLICITIEAVSLQKLEEPADKYLPDLDLSLCVKTKAVIKYL